MRLLGTWTAALLLTVVATAAGCGSSNMKHDAGAGKMDDKMMSDGKMSDGKMADGKMGDGKMADGKMGDGKMGDGKMADGKMMDGTASGEKK